MKKFINLNLIGLLALIIMSQSCRKMNVAPTDQMSTSSIASSSGALLDVTNGNYALLKDNVAFNGVQNQNDMYLRQYFQMSNFAGDNIVCANRTEDPLYYSFTYTHSPAQENARYFWYISYKIINGANTVIDIIKAKGSKTALEDQLEGESYFLRAFCDFNMVRFFAPLYDCCDPTTTPGIILRESAQVTPAKARATVKDTYDFIISDLKKSASLMNQDRGKQYASKYAAWAMLSRVYLYMNQYDSCIDYADSVINSGKYSLETSASYPTYFANALSRPETIWAVAFTQADNAGKFGSIASMLYSDGNSGWGEEFASSSIRDLMSQHLEDVRWDYIDTLTDANGNIVLKNGIQTFYITKFSFQDGFPDLSSPVMFRLSEMYLNRAESYAHLGKTAEALADVNMIRQNRGLGDALYTDVPSGETILDVVLNERRIELAFEGHRIFDLLRNHLDIVRDYWGYHITNLNAADINLSNPPSMSTPNVTIPWNSTKVQYYIPVDEILTNPLCTQNP
ncbi:MAG: RagB/SusD family nutrient uptake outer membrane protein [Bacteroidales bacterium]|nr:RagB/SusD family nutrient uptake outer membrane protein [Bacteroidales bacterium]